MSAALPKGWKRVALDQCCQIISGATPPRDVPEYWDGDIPWVTPKDISKLDQPVLDDAPEKITQAGYSACSTSLMPAGSILFSSRAPIGLVAIAGRRMCTNQGFKSLVPSKDMDSGFLYWTMKRNAPRVAALGNGATFKEVSKEIVAKFKIDLPPLDEQRRIAAILDKADAIRRKRQQALALADDFLRSAFLEMFGDPVTNPNALRSLPLGDVADFISGGTPSKERPDFWGGSFPWVSPKDMKREQIDSAEDGITEAVFHETSLKRVPVKTVLIVVRGMILAHTVPVALSMVPLAINQDMKGIRFVEGIEPEYALWCLKAQHGHMLTKIDTAAHGTKRFDLDQLKSLPFLFPTPDDQRRFVRLYRKFHDVRSSLVTAAAADDTLFAALSQRAFRGEI